MKGDREKDLKVRHVDYNYPSHNYSFYSPSCPAQFHLYYVPETFLMESESELSVDLNLILHVM